MKRSAVPGEGESLRWVEAQDAPKGTEAAWTPTKAPEISRAFFYDVARRGAEKCKVRQKCFSAPLKQEAEGWKAIPLSSIAKMLGVLGAQN